MPWKERIRGALGERPDGPRGRARRVRAAAASVALLLAATCRAGEGCGGLDDTAPGAGGAGAPTATTTSPNGCGPVGGEPTLVATGFGDVFSLAADDDTAFWGATEPAWPGLFAAPGAGAAPPSLLVGEPPDGMALHGAELTFTTPGPRSYSGPRGVGFGGGYGAGGAHPAPGVYAMPKVGGPLAPIAVEEGAVGIDTDGTTTCWSGAGALRCARAGAPPATLATGMAAAPRLAGAEVVALLDGPAGRELAAIDLATHARRTLAALQASRFALAGDRIAALAGAAVVVLPLAGGPATTLATAQPALRDVALDATCAYWIADDTLYRAPLAGGPRALVASFPGETPAFFASSARALYAAVVRPTSSGNPYRIVRVAK